MTIILKQVGQDQGGFDKTLPLLECPTCKAVSSVRYISETDPGWRRAVWKCCGKNLHVLLDGAGVPMLAAPWGINDKGHLAKIA